ncbi:MAG TPA: YggW family oxidoreductase, partial [Steroidobacteraceae bacterium]|nr:YggW family oxidoreductase [Steroidobacteraceae bacterium]
HGKVTLADGSIVRTVRTRHPGAYLGASSAAERVVERRPVTPHELPFEFCLNALRLVDGFAASAFSERTGLPIEAMTGPLDEARRRGLLLGEPGDWRPTALGLRFLNDLQALFLPG